MQLRDPWSRLRDLPVCGDALHVVAIGNLKDEERTLKRWWCKKYQTPEKPLEDYRLEELYVEYLEDYYERNPKAAEEFLRRVRGLTKIDTEWDGTSAPGVEEAAAKVFERVRKKRGANFDLSKFQSQDEISDADEKKILDQLGRKLPGSSVTREGPLPPALGDGEFEEEFGG